MLLILITQSTTIRFIINIVDVRFFVWHIKLILVIISLLKDVVLDLLHRCVFFGVHNIVKITVKILPQSLEHLLVLSVWSSWHNVKIHILVRDVLVFLNLAVLLVTWWYGPVVSIRIWWIFVARSIWIRDLTNIFRSILSLGLTGHSRTLRLQELATFEAIVTWSTAEVITVRRSQLLLIISEIKITLHASTRLNISLTAFETLPIFYALTISLRTSNDLLKLGRITALVSALPLLHLHIPYVFSPLQLFSNKLITTFRKCHVLVFLSLLIR